MRFVTRVALHHAAKGLPELFKKLLLGSQLNFGLSEVCNESVGVDDKLYGSLSVSDRYEVQQCGVASTVH